MKKIVPVFFALAVIFTFVGCSNMVADNKDTLSEVSISTISKDKSTDENNKNQEDSKKEVAPVKIMNVINITVDNIKFTSTLENKLF